jgi:tetratricopeptide (TPR) repeat protein
VQVEAIHALSLAESVLLARELPNLKRLFDDKEGKSLLQQTLRVVQGHPKMLELADGLAADRQALAARLTGAANDLAERADALDAFFAVGIAHEGETRQQDVDFVRALRSWTAGVADTLTPTARLLFAFLCRMEPVDRRKDVVEANWQDFLARLGDGHAVARAAVAQPEQGLPAALAALEGVGLVGVERLSIDPAQMDALKALLASQADPGGDFDPVVLQGLLDQFLGRGTAYTIHPGVAESERAAADPAVLDAADVELGNFHIAGFRHGQKTEMEGGGSLVVASARRAIPYLMRQGRCDEASNLLEQMTHRDRSAEGLAFALPVLRRIVEATAGKENGLVNAGILASTLASAGCIAEAEPMLRDQIARAAAQKNDRLALGASVDLFDLLFKSGRIQEALKAADETAGYTRQAGLGPWTQLNVEGRRLQALGAMGRYEEVLAAVEAARLKMDALPLKSEAEEAVEPWAVRETWLEFGRDAALNLNRWQTALGLNAEVVKLKQARGADELQVAGARFHDYFPLLRLGRYDDARELLMGCRSVFEAERYVPGLGGVYSALADLEDKAGNFSAARRFQEVALGYSYQAGRPEDCAISHHNLANYLERQGTDPATVLAHRLAAAVIYFQTHSGSLTTIVRNLANSDLPPSSPTFNEVAQSVESIEGLRFRALFESLPRTASDGDAAIAAVWQMVTDEKRRGVEQRQTRDAVLASAPAAVRSAFELEGDDFNAALRAALADLPETEAAALLERLRAAGLVGHSAGPDMTQVLEQFEPLLQAIALAVEEQDSRAEVDSTIAEMERNGWRLSEAAHRIWAGERDDVALTAGLDEQDTPLVRRVLEILKQ